MATTTTPAVKSSGGSSDQPSANGLVEYLQGVREELKKAQWPTRAEMIQLTKVVLLLIVVIAAYCGALDGLLSLVTNTLFGHK